MSSVYYFFGTLCTVVGYIAYRPITHTENTKKHVTLTFNPWPSNSVGL